MMLVGSFAERHLQRQWQALARMGATLLDAIEGLSTRKLFGQSAAANKRIERIIDSFRSKTLKALRVAFLSGAALEFMVAAAIGLLALTTLTAHGATYIAVKAPDPLSTCARLIARVFLLLTFALAIPSTVTTWVVQPQLHMNYFDHPWGFLFPFITLGSLIAMGTVI